MWDFSQINAIQDTRNCILRRIYTTSNISCNSYFPTNTSIEKMNQPHYQLGRAKRKYVFEYAKCTRFRFIPRMRKVSFRHLLSIDTFYSVQWLDVWMRRLSWAFAARISPKTRFAWRGPVRVNILETYSQLASLSIYCTVQLRCCFFFFSKSPPPRPAPEPVGLIF